MYHVLCIMYYVLRTMKYVRYTVHMCIPVPRLKCGKDNYMGVLIKHAIIAEAAAAESVAIGSRARSK